MEAASNKIVHRDGITDDAFTSDSGDIPEKYIRTNEHRAETSKLLEASSTWRGFSTPSHRRRRRRSLALLAETGVSSKQGLLHLQLPVAFFRVLTTTALICLHWFLLQLTNHGVDEAAMQRMKDSTVRFFGLPLDGKNAVAVRGDGFEGYGHHYSRLSKLDWAESVILITQPVQDRNMELWPTNPPMFRDALEEYSAAVTKLVARLLGAMAADLGVGREALVGAFAGKRQSVAIHHYPPCRHPGKVIGNTAHTDGLALAVLLHADDTPGLQVLRGGRWFPVRPPPGGAGLVVNVGDILHILTNGAYRSVEHRVVADAARRGRTTAVVFQDASVGGLVAPLPDLLRGRAAEAARYKSIPSLEYLKVRFSALAKRTGFLESLKL